MAPNEEVPASTLRLQGLMRDHRSGYHSQLPGPELLPLHEA